MDFKACKKCGSLDINLWAISADRWFCECEDCGTGSEIMETEQKAILDWNTKNE